MHTQLWCSSKPTTKMKSTNPQKTPLSLRWNRCFGAFLCASRVRNMQFANECKRLSTGAMWEISVKHFISPAVPRSLERFHGSTNLRPRNSCAQMMMMMMTFRAFGTENASHSAFLLHASEKNVPPSMREKTKRERDLLVCGKTANDHTGPIGCLVPSPGYLKIGPLRPTEGDLFNLIIFWSY